MSKLLLIFNPNAGSGRAQKVFRLIENHLNQIQQTFDVLITQYPGHGQSLVTSTPLTDYQAVISCGGDGTLFETVNGLMDHDESNRPPLGIIPVGTGNAFSRELGLLPSDWKKGLNIILRGQVKSVDLGHVKCVDESFYFINIIGMGFVVNCGKSTLKIKKLGKISYTLATLWETIKLKKHAVHVEIDSELLEDDMVFIEVANSRYTGTSFLIAPDAKIDDGLLDVIMLKNISKTKILRLFPSIYSGKHINYPEFETRQVRIITITTKQPIPLMPDGEFIGKTPTTISCCPNAIKLLY